LLTQKNLNEKQSKKGRQRWLHSGKMNSTLEMNVWCKTSGHELITAFEDDKTC